MKSKFTILFMLTILVVSCTNNTQEEKLLPEVVSNLRAPAYPLVTIDPYTSCWSFADELASESTKHWTGADHPLLGVITIDGKSYRFMGKDDRYPEAAKQLSVSVLPTQTHYIFEADNMQLDLLFTSPLLCDDLHLLSRPVSYISYFVKSKDGSKREVSISVEGDRAWAVDSLKQETVTNKKENKDLIFLSAGTKSQKILEKKGDNVRIDWGYFYLVGNNKMKVQSELGLSDELGKVNNVKSGYMMIGYDDLYSIQYFGENRMAYWKQDGKVSIEDAFSTAAIDYETIMLRCKKFNEELMQEATLSGGIEYAELCALAYRQTIAAHKLVTNKNGDLLFFSKENFSNGSIGTVDITYPSSPLFLYYSLPLMKGLLNFIFEYSESGKWDKPFPAHDLGTYPIANGQTYDGDMPIEESGNMLILMTAISLIEGNASYAEKHWSSLTTWANYLMDKGLDPDNQLCTDDFAGHFAHNANLSVKAIMGIAGYGKMAEMLGKKDIADKCLSEAKNMAQEWMKMADDGDHYKLTFDKPDTWSQKYNMVWDRLFSFNIFPSIIREKETAYYLTKQNEFGLPLDSRKDYTKSDWTIWSSMLTDDPKTFRALMLPVYKYANETSERIPLPDWYETKETKHHYFRARSVVGGYFIKLLEGKFK